MGNSLLNRCVFNADAAGTGDFVVDDAVSGYLTPSDAGAVNAASYSYSAESNEGLEWEIGTTVYTAATNTFSRTPLLSSNSNALVNFSTSPRVAITVLANDILSPTFSGSVIFNSTATFNGTASFTVPAEFADGTAALPSITNIGDTNTGFYFSAADEVAVSTGGIHAGLFDSSQRLILGHTTSLATGAANGNTPRLQIHGIGNSDTHITTYRWSADASGPTVGLFKSRGATPGTRGIVQASDLLGSLVWYGDDGTNGPPAARIRAAVDNTPGAGDMPGCIIFDTTPDGSTTLTERLRISSAGLTSVTGTFSVSSTSTFTGNAEFNSGLIYIDGDTNPGITIRNGSDVSKSLIYWDNTADALTLTRSGTNNLRQNSSNVWQINGNTVWHAGNDGAGSTLDADLLDGLNSTAFVQFGTTTTASMSFVIDEDTMSSNLDTKVPTQQSTKAYVDSKSPIGTQAIWVPAGSMQSSTTNGPSYYTTELATNKNMLNGYAFDTTTAENLNFFVALPKQWDEGTVTFRAYWTAASGSGGVAWSLAAEARSDDDAMDNAYGTAQTVTDTFIVANDLHVTSYSSAITIGSTPAEGDLQFFRITRAVSNGADTLAVDAILLGIEIRITTNASTDA